MCLVSRALVGRVLESTVGSVCNDVSNNQQDFNDFFWFVQVLCESMECLRLQESMKLRHPSRGKERSIYIREREMGMYRACQSGVEHYNPKAIYIQCWLFS